MDERHHIDDLFEEAFAESAVTPEEFSWSPVKMKLDKLRFYRFAVDRFNIYYASLIVATFILVVAVSADYFYNKRQQRSSSSIPIVQKDSALTLDKEDKLPKDVGKENKSNTRNTTVSFSSPSKSILGEGNNNSEELLTVPREDSSSKVTVVHSSNLQDSLHTVQQIAPLPVKNEKKKKVIYVSKRDTLYNVDTLHVKKKRSN